MHDLMAAIVRNDVERVRALLKQGANVNTRYLADYPLERAIRSGNLDVVQVFVESGVDVNLEYGEPGQRNKETALIFAVQHNQPEICRFLIAQGADPHYLQIDEQRQEDLTPLEMAINRNHQGVFEILLEHADLSVGRGRYYEGRHIHLDTQAHHLWRNQGGCKICLCQAHIYLLGLRQYWLDRLM